MNFYKGELVIITVLIKVCSSEIKSHRQQNDSSSSSRRRMSSSGSSSNIYIKGKIVPVFSMK